MAGIRKRYGKLMMLSLGFMALGVQGQNSPDAQRDLTAKQALSSAATAFSQGQFAEGEVDYRKAIALNEKNTAAYNLGNEYYQRGQNQEALMRYKESAREAESEQDKHRAFHNLGNAFMAEKQYQEAVESYKNALRNNPKDDESRYNLALAKALLEKNPPPPSYDQKDQDQEDQKEQEQEQEKEQEKDNNKDGDSEDQKDQKDQKYQKDQGQDQKDKEGKDQNQYNQTPPKPKNAPGQLSPQQVKNLLEAMNNEEKKVQDKMNLQKRKGAKVNAVKDW